MGCPGYGAGWQRVAVGGVKGILGWCYWFWSLALLFRLASPLIFPPNPHAALLLDAVMWCQVQYHQHYTKFNIYLFLTNCQSSVVYHPSVSASPVCFFYLSWFSFCVLLAFFFFLSLCRFLSLSLSVISISRSVAPFSLSLLSLCPSPLSRPACLSPSLSLSHISFSPGIHEPQHPQFSGIWLGLVHTHTHTHHRAHPASLCLDSHSGLLLLSRMGHTWSPPHYFWIDGLRSTATGFMFCLISLVDAAGWEGSCCICYFAPWHMGLLWTRWGNEERSY